MLRAYRRKICVFFWNCRVGIDILVSEMFEGLELYLSASAVKVTFS